MWEPRVSSGHSGTILSINLSRRRESGPHGFALESVEEAISIVAVAHPTQLLNAPQAYEAACTFLVSNEHGFAINFEHIDARARAKPPNKNGWASTPGPVKMEDAISLINVARSLPGAKELLLLVPHAFYVLARASFAKDRSQAGLFDQLDPYDRHLCLQVINPWLWLAGNTVTRLLFGEQPGKGLGDEKCPSCLIPSGSLPRMQDDYVQLLKEVPFDPLAKVDAWIDHWSFDGKADRKLPNPYPVPCLNCKARLAERHHEARLELWDKFTAELCRCWPTPPSQELEGMLAVSRM